MIKFDNFPNINTTISYEQSDYKLVIPSSFTEYEIEANYSKEFEYLKKSWRI